MAELPAPADGTVLTRAPELALAPTVAIHNPRPEIDRVGVQRAVVADSVPFAENKDIA